MGTEDAMAAVRQYIDGFNKGDAKLMAATFAVPGSILDGMLPHLWQGPTAAQDLYRDVLIEGQQHGASGYFVTLGEPLNDDVTGNCAYMVFPATPTRARRADNHSAGRSRLRHWGYNRVGQML